MEVLARDGENLRQEGHWVGDGIIILDFSREWLIGEGKEH